jgi:general stress protein 26
MKKLASLIKGAMVCMMTTHDAAGNLRSRPMALQATEVDGELWFFTGRHTEKARDLEMDNRINVTVTNPNSYVSVSGIGTLIDDKSKAAQLWHAAYRTWFPKGLGDPELVLLKVSIEHAEYWDPPEGPVTTLIGFVKGFATGEKDKNLEHQVVDVPYPTV